MTAPSGNPARLPYVPPPEALPGFPEARRTMPKGRRRRWVDRRGRIYEWDYQRGRVEVYDRRGRHLGEFDPVSGQRARGARSVAESGPVNTGITHCLVGYEPGTGRIAVEYPVPDRQLDFARQAAGVGEDDPQAVLCYRLDPVRAGDIAGAIGVHIDTDSLTFFLEGFAAP